MALGVELLKKLNADLFIATDPDADRMRAIILHNGDVTWLNGNQIACIMLYHVLKSLDKLKKLPKNAAFIKTTSQPSSFARSPKATKNPPTTSSQVLNISPR